MNYQATKELITGIIKDISKSKDKRYWIVDKHLKSAINMLYDSLEYLDLAQRYMEGGE